MMSHTNICVFRVNRCKEFLRRIKFRQFWQISKNVHIIFIKIVPEMSRKHSGGVPGFSGNSVKLRGFLFKFPENFRENFREFWKIFRCAQNCAPKICDHFFIKISSNFEPFLGHFSPIFRKTPLGANFQYPKKSQKIAKKSQKIAKNFYVIKKLYNFQLFLRLFARGIQSEKMRIFSRFLLLIFRRNSGGVIDFIHVKMMKFFVKKCTNFTKFCARNPPDVILTPPGNFGNSIPIRGFLSEIFPGVAACRKFRHFLHFLKIKFSTCEIGLGWCIRTETSNFLKFFCEDNFEQNCTFFVPGKSVNFRVYYLRETHAIAPKNAVAFSEGILGKIWTFLGDVHTEKITTFCKKFFTHFFQNPWNKIVSLRKFSVLFKFL